MGSARRPTESEGVEGRRAGCSRRCRRPCGSPRAHPAVPPHYPMQYRVAAHGPTLHRPSHSPQGPRKSIGLSKGVIRQSPEWLWSGPRQLRTAGLPRRPCMRSRRGPAGAERLAQAVFAGVIHNQDHGCLGSIGFCRCSLFDRVRPHTPCSRLRLVPIEHRLHYPLPFMLGPMYLCTQRIRLPQIRCAELSGSRLCESRRICARRFGAKAAPSVSASAPKPVRVMPTAPALVGMLRVPFASVVAGVL